MAHRFAVLPGAVAALVVALSCLPAAAVAAGRGGAPGLGPAPAGASVRTAPARMPRAFRHGHQRRWSWVGPGYADPWFYPQESGPVVALLGGAAEPAPPADIEALDTPRPRVGIRRGPVPQPTIYRLEGPRSHPAARVIRIAGADGPGGTRLRFAHAETGALLLLVPGR